LGNAGVLEVVENHVGGTWRAVYTVRFPEAAFVLHCFRRGVIAASPHRRRTWTSSAPGLPWRRRLQRSCRMEKRNGDGTEVLRGSGNIYADLGLPDAEKLRIKTGLLIEIRKIIREQGLTQQQAAGRMGITQPKVSAMMRGDFSNLSERKLMDCLTGLGYDVEIRVRPGTGATGQLVLAAG